MLIICYHHHEHNPHREIETNIRYKWKAVNRITSTSTSISTSTSTSSQQMNLFILSTDPAKAAEEMMDKHIHKILLEAVQMLCTAVRVLVHDPHLDPDLDDQLYKLAHKNHPVTIWCRTSRANFIWTLDHIDALHNEWKYRYAHPESKIHKSYLVAQLIRENIPADHLFPVSSTESNGATTPFALAMPVQYKDPSGDAVASYRAYYMSPEKTRIAKWAKRRSAPGWWSHRHEL